MDALSAAKIFAYCCLAIFILIIVCTNAYRRGRFNVILRWLKKKLGIGQFVEEKKDHRWRRRKRVDHSLREKHYFVMYKEENYDLADGTEGLDITPSAAKDVSDLESCKLLEGDDLDNANKQNDELKPQNTDLESALPESGELKATDSLLKDEISSATTKADQDCLHEQPSASTSLDQTETAISEQGATAATKNRRESVKKKPAVSFVSQASQDPIMKEIFQMFVGERAVYLYSSTEKELGCDLISHFHPQLIVSFQTCSDYTLLKFPPPPPLYNTLSDRYSVEEPSVERICFMESANVTIQHETKGSQVCLERCTVPQWGPLKDIDHSSMQILDNKLNALAKLRPTEKLKIVIHSSESLYVSTVILLECLDSMNDITKPAEIANSLKQINSLEISESDRKWVLQSLARCSRLQLDDISLETFAERHPAESISIEFCQTVIETLKELVPDMNMSQCVAAVQDNNRFQNRNSTIVPLDSEKPYLGGPDVSPTECDYINASFIKGYHSGYEFVVTEWPQFKTIPSFWRLVHRYGIPTIIIIAPSGPLKQKRFPEFWPHRGQQRKYASFGRYTVKAIADHMTQSDVVHTTNFEVTEIKVNSKLSHHCKLHYLPKWPAFIKSSDEAFITGLFKLLFDEWQQQRKHGKETKLCVVSSDGASKCGIMFSIWSVFDQIGASESRVFDCMNAIRLTKLNRPMLISSVEEVEIIYRILLQTAEKKTTITNYFNKRAMTSSISSLTSYRLALGDGVS